MIAIEKPKSAFAHALNPKCPKVTMQKVIADVVTQPAPAAIKSSPLSLTAALQQPKAAAPVKTVKTERTDNTDKKTMGETIARYIYSPDKTEQLVPQVIKFFEQKVYAQYGHGDVHAKQIKTGLNGFIRNAQVEHQIGNNVKLADIRKLANIAFELGVWHQTDKARNTANMVLVMGYLDRHNA